MKQLFVGAFDEGSKTVVYCKASLLTKPSLRTATKDDEDGQQAGAEKQNKNSEFFDRKPKTVS